MADFDPRPTPTLDTVRPLHESSVKLFADWVESDTASYDLVWTEDHALYDLAKAENMAWVGMAASYTIPRRSGESAPEAVHRYAKEQTRRELTRQIEVRPDHRKDEVHRSLFVQIGRSTMYGLLRSTTDLREHESIDFKATPSPGIKIAEQHLPEFTALVAEFGLDLPELFGAYSRHLEQRAGYNPHLDILAGAAHKLMHAREVFAHNARVARDNLTFQEIITNYDQDADPTDD